MIRTLLVSLVSLGIVVSAGCDKKGEKRAPVAAKAEPVGKDGIRRVSIEAGQEGYVPDKIAGKPGEKLVLVFTRTVDGDCLAQLKAPDGKLVDLPKNTAVEVAVTVPPTGKVEFACGMDMFKGVIVADPNG